MSIIGAIEFILNREAWTDGALCSQVGQDLFFPESGELSKPAKQVCLQCDVREQCLEYAMRNRENFGVWGGLSARERMKLRRSA